MKKTQQSVESLESLESMTGYGESRAQVGAVTVHCRVKSVNHRFLDVKLRLPRTELLGLDAAIRKRIADVFKRGALEFTVSIEVNSAASETAINATVAAAYWKELQKLSKKLGGKSKGPQPSLESLLRLPGVIGQSGAEEEQLTAEDEPELLKKIVEPALQQLKRSRLTEGARLAKHLIGLLDEMDAHVTEIKNLEGPEKEKGRQLMIERAQETLKLLTGLGPNMGVINEEFAMRLREEAVFWIERRDFDEERMRLSMHLKDFRAQITNPGELSGRKLEFIQQEILREINTLGTKAQSPAITTRTIELKTILERIREQLANVA